MNEQQFRKEIELSNSFKKYEKFKQDLTIKSKNVSRLFIYYNQAVKYGIEYIKQNQNILSGDVKLIEEILKNIKN